MLGLKFVLMETGVKAMCEYEPLLNQEQGIVAPSMRELECKINWDIGKEASSPYYVTAKQYTLQ